MNRITIDTDDLQSLARVWNAESAQIADVRLDLLRAWSDISPAAYPGVERLAGMADDISARLANLASSVADEASGLQMQALRADVDLLGRSVSLILCGFGPFAASFGTQTLASWLPMTSATAATFGSAPLTELEGVTGLPSFATGVGALDPLAALGAQNGALAPISGLLGQVQQVVNDPLGFLDGPQGQALAANNGALAPIQGLLNQTQAIVNNPLGFTALPPSSSGTPLDQLEQSALQQNINRILNGGSFPGSADMAALRGNFNALFPGGVNNFTSNLVASAKANGTFHPGINATAALQGQLAANAKFSEGVARFNPFQGIIEDNISRLNQINYMDELYRQATVNQARNLLANVNSQFGFNA
jgi:hypothetical protein